MPSPSSSDLDLVRSLAAQCRDLALSDEYEARRRRWRDANGRRKGDRAPVWCRPAGVWADLLPPSAILCEDPTCRSIEYVFRQQLYKDWVGDDHFFEPYWEVGAAWDCSTEHTWGVPVGGQVAGTELGGFRYDPPIKDEADFDRITVPQFAYNRARHEESASRMADILGEAMPVRMVCHPALAPVLGTYLDKLRGMGPMMEDIAFRPQLVHRAMGKLTEGVFAALRAAEECGALTPNNNQPMYCSDPLGGGEGTRLCNLWADANSQEFDQVSPAGQEEFLLNYQIPLFQQFGAVQYGCCENLTTKIESVLRIPNLRTFVCSAWTDLDKVIAACGKRVTIMWRQSAAAVVFPDDLAPIRAHLDEGLRKLQGCHYQIVLREVQTLQGHPNRIQEWAKVAIELAEKWA